jgi:membrane fusion protein, epimerase transport system
MSRTIYLPVASNPMSHAGKPLMFAFLTSMVLFSGFGAWSALTKLDSASHAPGRIVVNSRIQVVQHLEGGIINKILVKDGQKVNVGDPLIVLNEIQLKADLMRVTNQYLVAKGTKQRLDAEAANLPTVTFSEDVPAEIKASQTALFTSRRQAIISKDNILKERITSAHMEIQGLHKRKSTLQQQISLFARDIDKKRTLVNEKILVDSALVAPEAQRAEYEKELANTTTAIGSSGQNIQTSKLQMLDLKTEFQKEVNTELKTVEAQMTDSQQQMTAIQDKLTRTTVRAPASGFVMNLKYHTTGGVIPPASEIMSIVPENQKKTIEAQLNPQDIDSVKEGMISRVHLSSYKVTKVPPLNGRVTYVSGDTTVDQKTGVGFYTINIEIDEKINKIPEGVELTPGMPVDVFVVNGERTPLDYFLAPLRETMRSSFTEE